MVHDSVIETVDEVPNWGATGDREIRARRVHPRHVKLLDTFKTDIGANSKREAIAALLEYYTEHSNKVVEHAKGVQFR